MGRSAPGDNPQLAPLFAGRRGSDSQPGVTALPLVLEQTPRWYVFAVPMAVLMYFLVGRAVWGLWRKNWEGLTPYTTMVFVALVLGSIVFVLQPVGWQFRIDRDGLTLRAPMELWTDHGTITWEDLRDIRVGWSSGRGGSYPRLELVGADKVLVLQPLDGVPEGYWPVFAAAVEANAKRFAFLPSRDKWIEQVMATAHSEGSMPLATYVAHDAAGHAW